MSEYKRRVTRLEKGNGNGQLDYVIMFRDSSGVFRNHDGVIFLPEREDGLWRSTVDNHLVQGWIVTPEKLRERL